jgi:hypothetical protein
MRVRNVGPRDARFVLAVLLLGFTVTANGQATFVPRRGQLSGVHGFWWRGDVRTDQPVPHQVRNYTLGYEGLELRADMATASTPTVQGDSVVYTLTGTVTLRIPVPPTTTPAR